MLVAESALGSVRRAAQGAHPLETGGILAGVRVDGRMWITHAVEIASTARGHSNYRLPARTTRDIVQQLREVDPRIGYLGDWHSHPMDVPASRTDRTTLLSTAALTRRPTLMLVARRSRDDYLPDLLTTRGLRIHPCDLLLTGDLPPAIHGR